MNKPELQTKAKSLGIDTEGLTVAQLQEAIAQAEANNTEQTDNGPEAGEDEVETEDTPAETVETNATEENQATEQVLDDVDVDVSKENLEQSKETVVETEERPFFKDNRNRKFAFKNSAPATINIDGVILTQQEIIEDEEIMYELILGGNSFIEPIN